MINCLLIGIGGFIGSVFRYWMGFLPVRLESGFPVATLLINVIGAAVIGLIAALAAKSSSLNEHLVLFLKVGLCGGFTTFSTFSLETTALIQNGSVGVAVCYVALSVILCVAAVFGMQLLVR